MACNSWGPFYLRSFACNSNLMENYFLCLQFKFDGKLFYCNLISSYQWATISHMPWQILQKFVTVILWAIGWEQNIIFYWIRIMVGKFLAKQPPAGDVGNCHEVEIPWESTFEYWEMFLWHFLFFRMQTTPFSVKLCLLEEISDAATSSDFYNKLYCRFALWTHHPWMNLTKTHFGGLISVIKHPLCGEVVMFDWHLGS